VSHLNNLLVLLEYVPALDTNAYLMRGDKGAEYRKRADYTRCGQVLQVYQTFLKNEVRLSTASIALFYQKKQEFTSRCHGVHDSNMFIALLVRHVEKHVVMIHIRHSWSFIV
jgi:hypothetical protein